MNEEPSSTYIIVSWIPGYSGGYTQTFVVEYRVHGEWLWMNETNSEMNRLIIKDLLPDTQYALRMYAINKVNTSALTDEICVKTGRNLNLEKN